MKGDIHEYKRKLNNSLRKLEKSKLSKANKKAIFEFHQECFAEGLSVPRIERYVFILRQIAEILGKDFKKATKRDIIRVMQEIESRDYTEWTKLFYKVALKKFYRWLRGTKDPPPEVAWIKLTMKNGNHKLPEELLTPEDVRKMVESAGSIRDKALIAVLYESGCRIGELASLQIKNISFDKYGAILMVDGKTGMRRVRIINSVPYLASWLSIHPCREDPNSPVWVISGKCEIMKYRTIVKVLKVSAKSAGIQKRIYPHLFRHSRATYLAKHLTEAQMKQYFGWVQGSDMASVYVHLSGRDVDSALLKLNGINIDEGEKEKDNVLKPIACPRCEHLNPPTAKFCQRCGMALDLKTAMELEEERSKADKVMNILVKDPEVLQLLQRKIKELGVDNG